MATQKTNKNDHENDDRETTGKIILDIGYSDVDSDLESCMVTSSSGKCNVIDTVDNYIELLNKALNVLTIFRDAIYNVEKYIITLSTEADNLIVSGNQEILDRFIAFGIANEYVEDNDSVLMDSDPDESCSDSNSEEDRSSSDKCESPISSKSFDSNSSDSSASQSKTRKDKKRSVSDSE